MKSEDVKAVAMESLSYNTSYIKGPEIIWHTFKEFAWKFITRGKYENLNAQLKLDFHSFISPGTTILLAIFD